MAKLSNHEILDLAYRVGWREAGDLERVLAIVLAESSGNTEVTSWTGCCHGLMQINTRVHRQYTTAQMKQAEPNMRAGFALWQQRRWQPWDSSRGGQLLRGPEARLSTATWHASPGAGSEGTKGAVSGAVPDVAGAIPGLSGALEATEKARSWITTPANLGRLAMAVLAGGAILVGVATLLRPAAEQTVKTIAQVKP
jgi:Lysozyme like domain